MSTAVAQRAYRSCTERSGSLLVEKMLVTRSPNRGPDPVLAPVDRTTTTSAVAPRTATAIRQLYTTSITKTEAAAAIHAPRRSDRPSRTRSTTADAGPADPARPRPAQP